MSENNNNNKTRLTALCLIFHKVVKIHMW